MLRPWDVTIVLDRGAAIPAWQQIANGLTEAIRAGRLAPGAALPGTREMAAKVGVNRKTVQQSYDELVAQGWLTAEMQRGTFVSADLPVVEAVRAPQGAARLRLRGAAPEIPIALAGPKELAFDDGAPDTRLMPAELVAREWRRALLTAAAGNRLGYGDPRGLPALREAVAAMLRADRGLDVGPDNVCITRGSQQAIFLAGRLLAGEAVAMDALSYPPAREVFKDCGAAIVPVPMDEFGLDVEALERICAARPVAAIYVTPHHQFPTTTVLPQSRRVALLALAEAFQFAIVEDDYDHEFHYAHRPMLPLASAHGFGRLIYIGSLSKLLSPSLRIGYLVADPDTVRRAGAEICLIDRHGDPVTEAAAAALMASGAVKSHARRVLKIYEARRDFLAAALAAALGDEISFGVPQGGLALWVRFDAAINVAALAAVARRQFGLVLMPGKAFATNGAVTNGVRLGFGSLDEAELAEAVRRLTKAVRACSRNA